MSSPNGPSDRRQALVNLLRLSGLGAVSAGAGIWLSARSKHPAESQALSFKARPSIPQDPNLPEMVVAQGDDPRALVQKALDALGGMKRFIARGDVVLVKPNIGWDRTPEQAANTNPQLVAEVVRLCREAGASRVIVSDISCNEPRRCFSRSGIAEAATAEGAEVILPERGFSKESTCKGVWGRGWCSSLFSPPTRSSTSRSPSNTACPASRWA